MTRKPDGKPKVKQLHRPASAGALGGAFGYADRQPLHQVAVHEHRLHSDDDAGCGGLLEGLLLAAFLGLLSLLVGTKRRNTAALSLQDFQEQLTRSGIEIWLARMKSDVLAVIERAGLPETIPEDHYYLSVQAGVDAYLAEYGQPSIDVDSES